MNIKFKYISCLSVGVLSFIVLLSSFQFNTFKVMPGEDIYQNTHDVFSEIFVVGRMIEARKNGFFSHAGMMGSYSESSDWSDVNSLAIRHYNIFFNDGKSHITYKVYSSNPGFQGTFYALVEYVASYLGFKIGFERMFIVKFVNASLLASVISAFIVFVFRYFGLIAASFTILLIALSNWVVAFSMNMYWMLYMAILPFVISSLFFMRFKENNRFIGEGINILYLLLFIAIFIKSLAGYEYLSSILIAMIIPFIFFAIKDKWEITLFLKRTGLASIAAICGFIAAVGIHIMQLSLQQDGSFTSAISVIHQRMIYRTLAIPNESETVLQTYLGLENSFNGILKIYFQGNPFVFEGNMLNFYGVIATPVWKLVLALIIFSLAGYFLIKHSFSYLERLHLAFLSAMWFSILAPLSWFILARSHSYVHFHLNYILWYVPFLLLGFAYIGFILELITRKAFDGTVGLNQPSVIHKSER